MSALPQNNGKTVIALLQSPHPLSAWWHRWLDRLAAGAALATMVAVGTLAVLSAPALVLGIFASLSLIVLMTVANCYGWSGEGGAWLRRPLGRLLRRLFRRESPAPADPGQMAKSR
jgi:hypothetical protein